MFLLVGDSHVKHMKTHLNADWHVEFNPGVSAEHFVDAEFGMGFLLNEASYQAVFVIFGRNDIDALSFACSVGVLRAQISPTPMYLVGVNGSTFNLKADVDVVAETEIDGLHLTAEGRRGLARALKTHVIKLLASVSHLRNDEARCKPEIVCI